MTACAVPGCERPPRGRFCETHWKRHQRGRPLADPGEGRLALVDTALGLGDALTERGLALYAIPTGAEHDEEFQVALRRMEAAAEAWCLAKGWSPPRLSKGVCEDPPE